MTLAVFTEGLSEGLWRLQDSLVRDPGSVERIIDGTGLSPVSQRGVLVPQEDGKESAAFVPGLAERHYQKELDRALLTELDLRRFRRGVARGPV